jgi:hypothetical protein
MRRHFGIRIAAVVFVIFTATAPAFAASPSDDSPVGPVTRAIERVIKQIRRIFVPTDIPVVTDVKP